MLMRIFSVGALAFFSLGSVASARLATRTSRRGFIPRSSTKRGYSTRGLFQRLRAERRLENTPGDFYVDTSCIDCDVCRRIAPETFSREGSQSAVHAQPSTSEGREQALKALLACPTGSIRTEKPPKEIRKVQQLLPELVEDNVYYCGYHSVKSFASASYLIVRPEGNILVDSPRYAAPLVKRIEELGGVRWMFLTHRDDVADHAKFQEHFGCERIMLMSDITSDTRGVEVQLEGDEPYSLAPDITIIPTPGHSRGHAVMHYKDKFMFTGDHLAYSLDLGHLYGFRRFCWYSWDEQIRSMQLLKAYPFQWVLPGHGRRFRSQDMQAELDKCINWMFKAA